MIATSNSPIMTCQEWPGKSEAAWTKDTLHLWLSLMAGMANKHHSHLAVWETLLNPGAASGQMSSAEPSYPST